ncbi:MAG: pantoate--beta-alanine ligase [Mariniphaga sp.]|nr:pantoate--beta-alanine ligase [Mariniphaga sp.]
MKLYTTITSLQNALKEEHSKGLKIGFVPTMGALHQGHLSLVETAGSMCDIVVVSIFVNPTQFNDKNDLANYPRTLESDMNLLATTRCEYFFSPAVEEVYPVPDTRKFDFGNLETVMEGAFRPGHFNGVAQVVSRLFEIVLPDMAFFGRKDFQQMAIIKDMVRQLNLPIEIVPCDIIREKDGLAMSSRNKLLLPEYRNCAPLIYQNLRDAKYLVNLKTVQEIKDYVVNQINATQLLRVEYFEIVDDTTLMSVESWSETGTKVGCIAVYAGKIRLIDNIILDIN